MDRSLQEEHQLLPMILVVSEQEVKNNLLNTAPLTMIFNLLEYCSRKHYTVPQFEVS